MELSSAPMERPEVYHPINSGKVLQVLYRASADPCRTVLISEASDPERLATLFVEWLVTNQSLGREGMYIPYAGDSGENLRVFDKSNAGREHRVMYDLPQKLEEYGEHIGSPLESELVKRFNETSWKWLDKRGFNKISY